MLSEKSLEVLRLGGELDPEELNEEERASFERAIASGELVKPWEAWWESPEAGRPRASARARRRWRRCARRGIDVDERERGRRFASSGERG